MNMLTEPTVDQVAREFLDSLRAKKNHSVRKATSVLTDILDCRNKLDSLASDADVYAGTLSAYERGRLRKSRSSKPLLSSRKARLHSTLQVLVKLANGWPGLEWRNKDSDIHNWGVRIIWNSGTIGLRKVPCKSMKHNPKAAAAVWSFYEHINHKKFQQAWDLLEVEYQQERWQTSFERFEDGYSAFSVIENLQVFPRRAEPGLAIFDVFYEEEQMQRSITPLKVLQNLTIGKIKAELLPLLADLEEELVKAGGDRAKFDAVIFSRLFHADAPVALPWEMEIASANLKKQFPVLEHKSLSRGRRFRVVDVGKEEWRIKRITWLST